MPRRRRRVSGRPRRSGPGGRRVDSDVVRVPFHTINTINFVANSAVIQLRPDFGALLSSRLVNIGDNYEEFRFTKLRARFLQDTAPGTDLQCMGYLPNETTTPPATLVQCGEILGSKFFGYTYDNTSEWMVVPPGDLAGEQPWYKCNSGANAVYDVPGEIVMWNATATGNSFYELEGVCEFRGAANIGNTPEARAKAKSEQILREKARLEKLLTYPETDETQSSTSTGCKTAGVSLPSATLAVPRRR